MSNGAETPVRSGPFGCELSSLDETACKQYLAWILAREGIDAPPGATDVIWALAHCDDGVTWGHRAQPESVWRLGNAASEVSPPIRLETLQELRLFGDTAEVLIWRTEGGLQGRVLRDSDSAATDHSRMNSLCPSDEERVIRGSEVIREHKDGFTHIGDGAGAEQVLPGIINQKQLQSAQVLLNVRHYWESDQETGAVRIAATRLVTLAVGGS